jgi:hypothetical protein
VDLAECDTFGGDFWGAGTSCTAVPCSGATVYESTDKTLIVDPGNAVGTATVSPHDHLPASDAMLFYQVDDGAGIPGLIKLTKGGLGVMILF